RVGRRGRMNRCGAVGLIHGGHRDCPRARRAICLGTVHFACQALCISAPVAAREWSIRYPQDQLPHRVHAMRSTPLLLALVVPLILPVPASAREANPVKVGGNFAVETVKDVAYLEGKDADPVRHKLDLYLPKG